MIEITTAGIASIPVIRSLAYATWPVAYDGTLAPAEMHYMLQLLYNETALQKDMQEKNHRFIIATDAQEPAGFAAYATKEADQQGWHLHKIYVHPGHQGKRIGKLLLDFILRDIQSAGATLLELYVYRHNKAIAFYKKMGFTVVDEIDTDIGNGYFMHDYRMRLVL